MVAMLLFWEQTVTWQKKRYVVRKLLHGRKIIIAKLIRGRKAVMLQQNYQTLEKSLRHNKTVRW